MVIGKQPTTVNGQIMIMAKQFAINYIGFKTKYYLIDVRKTNNVKVQVPSCFLFLEKINKEPMYFIN